MIKNRVKYKADCAKCAANFICLPKGLETSITNELNAIITNFKEVSKGGHFFYAQDPMDYLYAVYSGSCKDYWTNENGDNRIHNFYFPGDIIGLESIPNRQHFFSLIALEDAKLCMIPIESLFEIMQKHNSLLRRVLNIGAFKMQNDQCVNMTTNVNRRLADFILSIIYRLKVRQKEVDKIILPMSQLDISLFLGVAHETVNRILSKLHKEKIINIDNKKIHIIDLDRLMDLGTAMPLFGKI